MQAQKSEDSSVYQDIKSLPTQVPVQPIIANIHSILDKNGL